MNTWNSPCCHSDMKVYHQRIPKWRDQMTKLLAFLFIIAIYIPYSDVVNNFMCVVQSPTCCSTEKVPRRQIPKRDTTTNPLDDIEFLVNTSLCSDMIKGGHRIWLVVGVVSYVNFFELRKAIRQTYGQILKRSSPGPICLVFLLSTQTKKDDTNEKLEKEIKKYKDIVQINKHETYENLVYKSIALLKWADQYVRHFDFLMKMDEDTYLNVPNLFHKLLMFSSQSRFIMGHLLTGAQPRRNSFSQHFISERDYSKQTLPNYMMGPSYVISGDLVSDLLDVVPRIPLVYVEDVYITGLLASYVNDVTHIGQCGFVRKTDDINGLPLSSVSVHGLLRWDIVLELDASLHSSQRMAASLQ